MTHLQLGGQGGPAVTLSTPSRQRTDWPDHFVVELHARGLHASITVDNPPYAPSLSGFFKELGNSPTAWVGARQWRSMEDELSILATCDPAGHVGLEFELRAAYGAAQGWRVVANVVVDLGSVERIADDLQELFAYEQS
jgi:hypothetical protein